MMFIAAKPATARQRSSQRDCSRLRRFRRARARTDAPDSRGPSSASMIWAGSSVPAPVDRQPAVGEVEARRVTPGIAEARSRSCGCSRRSRRLRPRGRYARCRRRVRTKCEKSSVACMTTCPQFRIDAIAASGTAVRRARDFDDEIPLAGATDVGCAAKGRAGFATARRRDRRARRSAARGVRSASSPVERLAGSRRARRSERAPPSAAALDCALTCQWRASCACAAAISRS